MGCSSKGGKNDPPSTHALSGTVSGAVADGVQLTLDGAATAVTITSGGGHYTFGNLRDGSYTVTPSLPGCAFSPQSLPVVLSGADVGGQDFSAMALTFAIRGAVTGAAGPVEVRLTGALTAVATTDAGGAYAFPGLPAGSYRVEPFDWACDPVARSLTLSVADASGQDFACTTQCVDLPYSGYIAIPSAETVDGKAWFFGGYENGAFRPAIRSFDVATSTWSTLPFTMPYGFADASGGVAQYAGGHFYVTPGLAANEINGFGSHNRIIDIDLAAGKAAEGATVPYGTAVWDMQSCAAGGKLYFFGGVNGADQLGIFEYTPGAATMTRVANMTYAHRLGKVTLGADGKMYIMGQSAQIERFDPVQRTVDTMRSQLPAELVGFAAISTLWHVADENAIYITPGVYTGSRQDPPVYKFDYAADTLAATGAVLPGWVAGNHFWNIGFRDGRFPHVAFHVQGSASTALYRLCRARLPVP